MRAAGADHAVDLGEAAARCAGAGAALRLRDADSSMRVEQFGDRRADRGPVRLGVVARPAQRVAQARRSRLASRSSGSPVRRSSGRSAGLPSAVR